MNKNILHCLSISIITLLLSFGCASTNSVKPVATSPQEPAKTQDSAPLEKSTVPSGGTEVSPSAEEERPPARQSVQEMTLPGFVKPPSPRPLPEKIKKEPIDPGKILRFEGPVMLNAESMPLSDFIIYALGDTLKVTFFIDEHVKEMKNPITLRMTQEMPAYSVLELVIGFLEKHDLIIEEKAGALYITKTKAQPQRPPVDVRIGRTAPPDSPAEIMQVVPMKYIRYNDIEYIIKIVYKNTANILQFFKDNTMIVSGPASAVKEVVDIIELFDIPYVADKKISMLKLIYWNTDDFIKQLSSILQGLNIPVASSIKEPGIVFIPIKFLNTILVVAPDEDSMKYVLDWYKRLDTDESAGAREKAFTYTPRFSRASDLVGSLKNLYIAAPPATAAPAAPKAPTTAQAAQSLSIEGLKVAADDKRNIILIHSTPAGYKSILSYLERLDVPPRQVLLEATIAELKLSGDLEYGLEWYIKDKMNKGEYSLGTLGNLGIGGTGFVYSFITNSKNFETVLNLFAKEEKINIVSRPRLMALDNEESSIQVGSDVPYNTGETKTESGGQVTTTSSVSYRNTGLLLRVKPTINTEGILTLSLSIEESSAEGTSLNPTFLTKKINTLVAAATGQSIMLGGLMSNSMTDSEQKVPLLGDIPLLGNLFKTTSKISSKRELIILITPTIITNTESAVAITNELKQELKWFR